MNIRRLLCVVLLGLGFTAPLSAQERCTAEPVASLPIVMLGGKVVIPVQINDQPALFLIDSVGAASAISETTAQRMKLKTFSMRADRAIRGIGGKEARGYALIDALVLGNLKADGERYMLGEFDPGIDGRISHDYLRNFDLDLDFPANRLNLYRPRACAGSPPGSGEFSSVGMDVMRSGYARIPVTMDGKDVWALVNIGSGRGTIAASPARSLFDVKASETGRVEVRGATGGSTEVAPHTFSSLQIGNVTLQRPVFGVAVDEDELRTEQSQLDLGLAAMRGLRFYVSYRERKFYVSRPAAR
jgi:predicted aspartyl protease